MNIGVLSLYACSVLLLICSNSLFSFWIMIEFNSALFIILALSFDSEALGMESMNQFFYYFIIQACVSVLMLLSLTINNFFFFDCSTFVTLCLSFNIGLFPLHLWVFNICNYIEGLSLAVLLGPHKIFLMYLSFIIWDSMIIFIFWGSLYFGTMLIFNVWSLSELLVCSSLSGMIISFAMFNSSPFFFFFYYFIYVLVIFLLLVNIHLHTLTSSAILNFSSLTLLSSPIMPFFLFKFQLIGLVLEFFSFTELFLLWSGFFLAFCGYLSFFFYFFCLVSAMAYSPSFFAFRPLVGCLNFICIFYLFFF